MMELTRQELNTLLEALETAMEADEPKQETYGQLHTKIKAMVAAKRTAGKD